MNTFLIATHQGKRTQHKVLSYAEWSAMLNALYGCSTKLAPDPHTTDYTNNSHSTDQAVYLHFIDFF